MSPLVITLSEEPFIREFHQDVSMAFKKCLKTDFDEQKFFDITNEFVAGQFHDAIFHSLDNVFMLGRRAGQFLYEPQHPSLATDIKRKGRFELKIPPASLWLLQGNPYLDFRV
jgi:hypothetical protein